MILRTGIDYEVVAMTSVGGDAATSGDEGKKELFDAIIGEVESEVKYSCQCFTVIQKYIEFRLNGVHVKWEY